MAAIVKFLLVCILLALSDAAVGKTLVLYSYFEKNYARTSLDFFLKFAVPYGPCRCDPYCSCVSYIFIVNGEASIIDKLSKQPSNVYVVRRENLGMDLCAYRKTLDLPWVKTMVDDHTHFIFLNCGLIGPFLSGLSNGDWISTFTNKLDARTKLTGTSINCLSKDEAGFLGVTNQDHTHIQSMIFATDRVGLDVLSPALMCSPDKWQTIINGEIQITQRILQAGFNIAVQMILWKNHNFLDRNATLNKCKRYGNDAYQPHRYGVGHGPGHSGIDLSIFEMVFFKASRGVHNKELRTILAWMGIDWKMDARGNWIEKNPVPKNQ